MVKVQTRSRLSITDLNDSITGSTPPANPEKNSLWLDVSVSPPVLKYWDGKTWIPQRLDLAELDPDLSVTIETIEETMGTIANDNLLIHKDRGIIVENLYEIIGKIIANETSSPTALPTIAQLDTGGKGNFYQVRKTAVEAGIAKTSASYVAVGNAYTALVNYLTNMTPIKAWDVTNANKAKNISVVKNTFRQTWLNYYLAVQKLAEDTAYKIKQDIDDNTTAIGKAVAEIGIVNGTIKLLASKEEVKNSLTAYPTKEELKSELAVSPNGVLISVYKAIQGIAVGGRNYYKESTILSGKSGLTTFKKNYEDAKNGFYFVGINGNKGGLRVNKVITSNGYWTVSFYVRGSQNTSVGFTLDVCDLGVTKITTTANNTWKRVELTVNVTNYSEDVYHFVDFDNVQWAYFYLKDFKVEKGNKATDWTPAQEDMASKADISVLADQIKLAVEQSKTYTDTKSNEVKTWASGQINVKADEIMQKVETITQEKVNNIEVGELNLVENSTFNLGKQNWNRIDTATGIITSAPESDKPSSSILQIKSNTGGSAQVYTAQSLFAKAGEQYTLSFDFYLPKGYLASRNSNVFCVRAFSTYDNSKFQESECIWSKYILISQTGLTASHVNKWHRVKFSFTIPASINGYLKVIPYWGDTTGVTIAKYREIFLTKGTKQTTNWKPHLKDARVYKAWANNSTGSLDFTRIEPKENLVAKEDIYPYSSASSTAKFGNTNFSNRGEVVYARPAATNLGIYLHNYKKMKNSTTYTQRVVMKRVAGTITKILVYNPYTGLTNAKVTLDGVRQSAGIGTAYTQEISCNFADGKEHVLEITFTTPSNLTSTTPPYKGFILQLNKNTADAYEVLLYECKLEQADVASKYTFAPVDNVEKSTMQYIGYSAIPSNLYSDYVWQPNTDSVLKTAWSNSEDGKLNFTKMYPNENLFASTLQGHKFAGKAISNQTEGHTYFTKSKLGDYVKVGDTISFMCKVRISGSGFAGQINPRLGGSSWTATAESALAIKKAETVTMKRSLQVNSTMLNDTYINFRLDNVPATVIVEAFEMKLELGRTNTMYMPSPQESPVKSRMRYIGYCQTSSDNYADYHWQLNSDNVLQKAWANSPDGLTDFTTIYPSRNLADDAYFSKGYWLFSKNGTTVASYSIVSGAYRITTDGTGYAQGELRNKSKTLANVVLGKRHSISFEARLISGNCKTAEFHFTKIDTAGASTTVGSKAFSSQPLTTAWQKYTHSFDVPTTAKGTNFNYWRIVLRTSSSATAPLAGVWEFRKVKFETSDTPTIYLPAPEDDPIKSEMLYEGTSLKGGNNPADYSWGEMYATASIVREVSQKLTPEGIFSTVSQAPEFFDWKKIVDSKPSASDLNNVLGQLNGIDQSINGTSGIIAKMSEMQLTTSGLRTEVTQAIKDINGNISTISSYFTFGSNGLTIGKSNSKLLVNLTNNKMSFLDDGVEVAYFASQKLMITEAEVINKIKLGRHVFEKFEGNANITVVRFVG